jgi:putative transcriptional regulator
MDTQTLAKDNLAKRIAGEIVLSDEAGKVIQKWRNIFKLPQRRLADEMGIMPSVISDYENGRRKSPGIRIVKKMVQTMIALDEKVGGRVIQEFAILPTQAILSDAVLDMKEFDTPIDVTEFNKIVEVSMVVNEDLVEKKLYGYTVVDSLKAITDLSPIDMVKLYGLTSERALIFAKAHTGRSAMIALKVTNLRPGLVILQGSEKIDELAKRIGELENIPIGLTKIKNVDDLLKTLKKNF